MFSHRGSWRQRTGKAGRATKRGKRCRRGIRKCSGSGGGRRGEEEKEEEELAVLACSATCSVFKSYLVEVLALDQARRCQGHNRIHLEHERGGTTWYADGYRYGATLRRRVTDAAPNARRHPTGCGKSQHLRHSTFQNSCV